MQLVAVHPGAAAPQLQQLYLVRCAPGGRRTMASLRFIPSRSAPRLSVTISRSRCSAPGASAAGLPGHPAAPEPRHPRCPALARERPAEAAGRCAARSTASARIHRGYRLLTEAMATLCVRLGREPVGGRPHLPAASPRPAWRPRRPGRRLDARAARVPDASSGALRGRLPRWLRCARQPRLGRVAVPRAGRSAAVFAGVLEQPG